MKQLPFIPDNRTSSMSGRSNATNVQSDAIDLLVARDNESGACLHTILLREWRGVKSMGLKSS